MKRRMAGFQKRTDDGKRKPVRVAIIRARRRDDGSTFMACSCGQPFLQKRDKPRSEAIAKHIEVKHDGQGLWL